MKFDIQVYMKPMQCISLAFSERNVRTISKYTQKLQIEDILNTYIG